MKKKHLLLLSVTLVLATVINLFAGVLVVSAIEGDGLTGSGTESDPYLISSKEDLLKLEGQTLTAGYKLTANIDLEGADWTPLGDFSGTFDGNGYTISGFKITSTNTGNVAFIGKLTGTLKNLTVANATVNVATNGTVRDVAVLVANLNGTILNCKIENTVTMNVESLSTSKEMRFGGVCGYAGGNIAYCENNADITCAPHSSGSKKVFVGGIAGMSVSTIDHCINNGDISMTNTAGWKGHLGGILGGTATWSASTTVSNCVNTGSIGTQKDNPVGGIIGCVSNGGKAIVNNNYNFGTVTLTGGGDGVAAGQILGFENATYLTSSADNYALTGGAAIVGFTSGGESVALNGSLDTEANLKAQDTYKAIVAEVAEHITGISTDLYGYQTTAVNGTTFDLRLVATLSGDYTKCQNVGFEVDATYTDMVGEKKATKVMTTLYNSITATDGQGAETATTTHTAASLGGDYIFVLACKGIPADAQDLTFTVTTFYTGANGAVYSEVEVFAVEIPADTLA